MGQCSSTISSQKRRRPSNSSSSKSSNDSENPHLPIINRISARSNFNDITKFYSFKTNILGKGATGIVRQATSLTNESYAIKTIWKGTVDKNECFMREIDITLDLKHDNVIKCYGIYEDSLAIHLVLELIEGGDLFDHIIHSNERKLKENEAIDLFEQMLQALCYLHEELHVVHRDIKPENFLIFKEQNRIGIKLIDFGFAIRAAPGEAMGQQLGTPHYTAPEIFEKQPYTNKVDLWSVGVVLYNMINGTQPFSGDIETIHEQVLHKEIDFSGFQNEQLRNLCMNLLERDPQKRYTAYQALSIINIIKDQDESLQTIPSNFKPNMPKIIYMLNNDRALNDELRNIFLEHFTLEQLITMRNNLLESDDCEEKTGLLFDKTYFKAEKIIDYILKQSFINEEVKKDVHAFIKANGQIKIANQMINVHKFFNTAIECKKLIRKQRVWHEFKKYDKYSRGYITQQQVLQIFKDEGKRKRIVSVNKNALPNVVQFEQFYQMWSEYEGIATIEK